MNKERGVDVKCPNCDSEMVEKEAQLKCVCPNCGAELSRKEIFAMGKTNESEAEKEAR